MTGASIRSSLGFLSWHALLAGRPFRPRGVMSRDLCKLYIQRDWRYKMHALRPLFNQKIFPGVRIIRCVIRASRCSSFVMIRLRVRGVLVEVWATFAIQPRDGSSN